MDIPAPFHRLIAWFKRQSRITRDLVVMGAVGLPLYLLAVWYDAFDKFLALTQEPESDAIDWLIILFVFLGIAAKIFSVRRVADLHREVERGVSPRRLRTNWRAMMFLPVCPIAAGSSRISRRR